MNFFLVEVSEENPGAASNIGPEEGSNHPHSEKIRAILYFRLSDVVTGQQAGTAQEDLRKAFVNVERYIPSEWENIKKHLRPPTIPDMPVGDLEDIGILVGKVYDERIIEDSLRQGENPIDESLITLNQNKKGC